MTKKRLTISLSEEIYKELEELAKKPDLISRLILLL